jgi:hypothetical protein
MLVSGPIDGIVTPAGAEALENAVLFPVPYQKFLVISTFENPAPPAYSITCEEVLVVGF